MQQISPGGGGSWLSSPPIIPTPPHDPTFQRFLRAARFPKSPANKQKNNTKGFALVELIVVIVILGILLAIAIPALTGYIQKAENEQYIIEAKTRMTAVRAIISESYGEGMFNTPAAQDYIEDGYTGDYWLNLSGNKKMWHMVGTELYGDGRLVAREASKLIGVSYPSANFDSSQTWGFHVIGSKNPETTLLNADGFVYFLWQEGETNDLSKPLIIVTYKMNQCNINAYLSPVAHEWQRVNWVLMRTPYNADAEYEVYRVQK
ncbi:MAG: type II secretion system GspH family protein [Coriobacteriales bacterium]|jgi:prepilin-type N-terminal cleavage/methylation domain-containing protein|nr:type II secretion system GspH family protein [Coriobacteriales bacterium]